MFDGLREKIFDAIIELLQEASHTTTGLQLTQETCRKVADCIVNSNETVGNGEGVYFDYNGGGLRSRQDCMNICRSHWTLVNTYEEDFDAVS